MIIFCILYYIFSMCQSVPCIYKLITTKQSNDYSLLNRLFQYLGLLCWTIYLCSTINWTIEWYLGVIGFINVTLLSTENVLILKYYNNKIKNKGDSK